MGGGTERVVGESYEQHFYRKYKREPLFICSIVLCVCDMELITIILIIWKGKKSVTTFIFPFDEFQFNSIPFKSIQFKTSGVCNDLTIFPLIFMKVSHHAARIYVTFPL